MPSIRCESVTYRYPLASADALRDVSFSASEGELVGGAGKGHGARRERVAAAIRCADRPWTRGLFLGKTRRRKMLKTRPPRRGKSADFF